ncbi:hypothetical protein [Actinoplanes sp. TFC3]|uniref:hypothetical protein n=1 Tax=Actinoplanes sp. TFC3 TaxID=1710355 RepID=UPI000831F0FF|nr:hypothetical protein [Actinoplanes sp. TFC3]
MELRLRLSGRARDFIEQVVHEMVVRFPITRDEAVGRVNHAWGHLDYLGDEDLIFHEPPDDWARTIYYGKDSRWWQGEDGLEPLPYGPDA